VERELERPARDEYPIGDVPLAEGKKSAPRSLLRCPFCHGDVRVEARDWVACRDCLARHHEACWRESGRCATCGREELLETRAAPSSPILSTRAYAAILAAFMVGLAVMFFVGRASKRATTAKADDTNVQWVVSKPASAGELPYTHGFFRSLEDRTIRYVGKDRQAHVETIAKAHGDVLAGAIRRHVEAGDEILEPSPERAARLLRKTAELYNLDDLAREARGLTAAAEKLAPVSMLDDGPFWEREPLGTSIEMRSTVDMTKPVSLKMESTTRHTLVRKTPAGCTLETSTRTKGTTTPPSSTDLAWEDYYLRAPAGGEAESSTRETIRVPGVPPGELACEHFRTHVTNDGVTTTVDSWIWRGLAVRVVVKSDQTEATNELTRIDEK
jgi:hypothetical protein